MHGEKQMHKRRRPSDIIDWTFEFEVLSGSSRTTPFLLIILKRLKVWNEKGAPRGAPFCLLLSQFY